MKNFSIDKAPKRKKDIKKTGLKLTNRKVYDQATSFRLNPKTVKMFKALHDRLGSLTDIRLNKTEILEIIVRFAYKTTPEKLYDFYTKRKL